MSLHRKVYRFRMRPTKVQEQALSRMAGARRWVWNWALGRRREHYKESGETLSYQAMAAELTALKKRVDTAWLKEADSQSLQQVLMDVCRAFVNFFEKRARFPRFKSKKRDTARFRIPQRVKVDGEHVVIPKVGRVRFRKSMEVDLPTKGATFKRDATGRWFVTLTAEFEMPDVALPIPDLARVVGIDLGLKDFATFTDADPIPAPKFYRKAQRKLRKAQRVLSRRKPGSNRKAKAKVRVARIHREISNHRGDFLHKLSTRLVDRHDGLCIEDLCLKGLVRTKRLSKSFTDASFGEFKRQLIYKSEWNRKHLAVIDRWFPSSKMCRHCKRINAELTLSDRVWSCECGAVHDRDKNAAWNIKDEGLKILAVGHTERQNARGRPVRLSKGSKAG